MSDVKERIDERDVNEELRREDRPTTADVARDLAAQKPRASSQEQIAPLMTEEKAQDFRSRWSDIQASFVDEPRQSVEQADSLVAEVMQHLAKTFADERQNLEGQWGRGNDVSTEDLRIALQRYRSFFSRLLSV